MNNTDVNHNPNVDQKENVVAGIVGAFLFSLAGGIVWYLLYQVGFIAGISGIVGVVCAIKGYALFAKKESVKGVILASVMAFLVIVIAWYICLSQDVYNAYQEWFAAGEIDYTVTFFESVRHAYLFLEDTEVLLPYLGDLALGLLFCAAGGFSSIRNAIRGVKAKQTVTVQPSEPVLNGEGSEVAESVNEIPDEPNRISNF